MATGGSQEAMAAHAGGLVPSSTPPAKKAGGLKVQIRGGLQVSSAASMCVTGVVGLTQGAHRPTRKPGPAVDKLIVTV